jgi:DNA-directed RNA polymerase subunit RPC12/RpoP
MTKEKNLCPNCNHKLIFIKKWKTIICDAEAIVSEYVCPFCGKKWKNNNILMELKEFK